jgi:hypothetical protein
LVVLRLITSSNLVGVMTGKSAGLAPFKVCPDFRGGDQMIPARMSAEATGLMPQASHQATGGEATAQVWG